MKISTRLLVAGLALTLAGTAAAAKQDDDFLLDLVPSIVKKPAPPPTDPCKGYRLCQTLKKGAQFSGTQKGGTFGAAGWRNDMSGSGMLIWNLGAPMSSGVIEVDVKGLRPNQPGGYSPGSSKNRGYFISLFNKPHGDKGATYTNSAFVEARLNIGSGYSAATKHQTGTGIHHDSISEVYGLRKRRDWNPAKIYHFRITFKPGLATMWIDGKFESYSNFAGDGSAVAWKYLYLGRNNYKNGAWKGPGDLTFSNLKVKAQ